jgi:enolase-phosphatase E1
MQTAATFRPAAIVTDIEGTTSAIDFVHRVLFPYSRDALPAYIRSHAHDAEVAPWVAMVIDEIRCEPDNLAAVVAALLSWIDADRKHTALKALQGQVWAQGFAEGRFKAHVYEDALLSLKRWHDEGIPLYIYSSGSIQAQKLYFGHTEAGDLRHCFAGYFDTTTGGKREAESYRKILGEIGTPPERSVFLSDIGAELDAAREAGMRTWQLLRPGTAAAPAHAQVASFADLPF